MSTNSVLSGRYQLESPISAGAVGEVWRADDLVLDRAVAVKLLRPEYAGHPDALARFRAEARHAGGVSHPGIAQIFDYCEGAPGCPPYIVMELVNGPSLAGVLTGGPLRPDVAMGIVAQAAAGLAAAHAVGLVHRDIKPANLLIAGDHVKITDFGIAYAAGAIPLTRTGTLVGTPAYLAPERAAGYPATPASDIYSLGVLAYECLTGHPPFRGPAVEVAAAHRTDPMPPLPPGVPEPVAALIADMTEKDPHARPATAGEVAWRAAQHARGILPGWPQDGTQPGSPQGLGTPPGGPAVVGVPGAPGATPGDPAAPGSPTLVEGGFPTLITGPGAGGAGPGGVGWADDSEDTWGGRFWGRRTKVAAAAGAALLAGLVGWLLVGSSSTPPGHGPLAAPSSPATPAPPTVRLDAATFVGKPAHLVARQLRADGLRPKIQWVHGVQQQPPGTVVSVQPAGQVPVGTPVVVTAVFQPPGPPNGPGQGGGGGDGGGPGNGGNGGNGDGNGNAQRFQFANRNGGRGF
jgi:hypothetical protein